MASPSGTNTALPSERTACPPTRSRFSPRERAASFARRMMVLRSCSSPFDAVASLGVTTARTTWPGAIPYSARIPRIAPTSSCTRPKSRNASGSWSAICPWPRCDRDRGSFRAAREFSPERLGNERHHGVQEAECHVERLGDHCASHVAAGLLTVEPWLDLLDVPVRQVAPDEAVDGPGGFVQAKALVRLRCFNYSSVAAGQDPSVRQGELFLPHHYGMISPEGSRRAIQIRQYESSRIPQLVREVAGRRKGGLQILGIQNYVCSYRHTRDQRVAERIRAVAFDDLERIDPVA